MARGPIKIVYCGGKQLLSRSTQVVREYIGPCTASDSMWPQNHDVLSTLKALNALPSGGAFLWMWWHENGFAVCCRRAVSARSDCMWLRPLWGGCIECSYALFEGDLIEIVGNACKSCIAVHSYLHSHFSVFACFTCFIQSRVLHFSRKAWRFYRKMGLNETARRDKIGLL